MARLTVDLALEQVRAIVRDVDRTLEPTGFARLQAGANDVYRIDLAGARDPLVLKIYGDEPAWNVAKEALVAGWIGERAGIPFPRWPGVEERRACTWCFLTRNGDRSDGPAGLLRDLDGMSR